MSELNQWLSGLGLENFTAAFHDAQIQFSDLPDLTEEDLKEIGLPVGPRRRASNAIRLMRELELPVVADNAMKTAETGPAHNQSASTSDAERRHLTVMFVDLVGSTEMAGRIDAEDMRYVITSYQNTVAGVVSRYEGFVAKFMGDGVLCYFGWPRANEDDAERAVRAGLSIIDAVKKTKAPDGTPLATRIGIATGVVIVGDLIGSGATQEAAVVGETPNLAARLQGIAQTKPVGPARRDSSPAWRGLRTAIAWCAGPQGHWCRGRGICGGRRSLAGKPLCRAPDRQADADCRARAGNRTDAGALGHGPGAQGADGHRQRRGGHRQVAHHPGGN